MNPLKKLKDFGQSVWLDYIRRGIITSGELRQLIEKDGLAGVTSNPAIFGKAITGSTDYREILQDLRNENLNAKELYERIAVRDIQDAADILKSVYEGTNRRDGYVSLEVSPYLAKDTTGTIEEARRLWKDVGRENLMIKVPATPDGIPAIEQLIGEGINVNVTLIFSLEIYEKVAEAYLSGLEKAAAGQGSVKSIASVASFFISRIDAAVDRLASERLKSEEDPENINMLTEVMGKVAIANARLAYVRYREFFSGKRWDDLAAKGAQTQRLLWASTSTKNPQYSDVLYVEELVGADTVNTIPPATFDAYRAHGNPESRIEKAVDESSEVMYKLEQCGISMRVVTDGLLEDGVRLFAEAFDNLLATLDTQCKAETGPAIKIPSYSLTEDLRSKTEAALEDWQLKGKVRKLWARDATLWSSGDESRWLDWLGITRDQLAHGQHLQDIADDVRKAGFSHAMLLGMGGSSLGPEVLELTFGKKEGFPQVHVLDSTDPAQIKTFEKKVDPGKTLFIVSSKSGSTLEPNIFKQYFIERVQNILGKERAGENFIAITDPGSQLEKIAKRDGFRRVFHGVPGIGGRYSVLSDFGMVPAAVMGIDAMRFIDHAEEMASACSSCVPVEDNPGVVLGVLLGVLAVNGHDKVTIVTSPGIHDFGAWLEQLLAESTGKQGRGIIPVDREELGPPEVYGSDRTFVYVRLESGPDKSQDRAVNALEDAGQPVVTIPVREAFDIGQEFFRWEIATAVAGSIIGINPFNQPDVEASKVATRNLSAQYEKSGSFPKETSIFEEDGIRLFTDKKNEEALRKSGAFSSLTGCLEGHLDRLKRGDYFALLAYVEMNEGNEERLQAVRHLVRDGRGVATCLGFGPRFLHSTGQAYKGGPNTGVFLQITCDDPEDIVVPGQRYSFGVVKAAQALGDFQVLSQRDRRLLRVHLGADVAEGLKILKKAVEKALS
jgi:transaldolase/glucose-6-phosphate isomerase